MQSNITLINKTKNQPSQNSKNSSNNNLKDTQSASKNNNTGDIKNELTPRSLIIGCAGSVVISAASVYCAVKMGSLPWPIVFVAMISLFLLKLFRKNKTNLNEVNVTHTAMSAGAMIGGGLAFTIPGIWILHPETNIDVFQVVIIALCGTALGLAYTALLRKRFIDEDNLSYPVGASAAHALKATESGGKQAAQVFGSMGFAAVFAALRDWLALLPATLFSTTSIPGVTFGIINSPMMIGVGFLIGTSAAIAWFAGGVIGDFLVVCGGSAAGLWDIATAQGIKSSLGMGAMIGCGVAVIIKFAFRGNTFGTSKRQRDKAKSFVMPSAKQSQSSQHHSKNHCADRTGSNEAKTTGENALANQRAKTAREKAENAPSITKKLLVMAGIIAVVVAAVLCFALQLGPAACIIVVILTFLTVSMSAQSVGESGINPMEVFGVMVLLVVAALSNTPQVQLFFIAAVVSVACGLMGDVMNDFKAGKMLGTQPRAQWIAQAAGGVVGAIVSALVLCLLVSAFGTDAFGTGKQFVAAQAEVVATMISGIPNMPAFVIGAVAICALYLLGLPVITVGIGIYLPFTYSLTIIVALIIKKIAQHFMKRPEGTDYVAAGFLGGESITGVIIALASVAMATFTA